jgi:putative membrane protein
MRLFIRWFLLAAALMLVAHTCPGVEVKSYVSALIAAAVLGLLNTLLRPILVLLTLPVTVVTLGLFLFVINAVLFYFAGRLLEGFEVSGASASLIGSLMYTALGVIVDWISQRSSDRD